jgi:hypothetical protein
LMKSIAEDLVPNNKTTPIRSCVRGGIYILSSASLFSSSSSPSSSPSSVFVEANQFCSQVRATKWCRESACHSLTYIGHLHAMGNVNERIKMMLMMGMRRRRRRRRRDVLTPLLPPQHFYRQPRAHAHSQRRKRSAWPNHPPVRSSSSSAAATASACGAPIRRAQTRPRGPRS